MHVVFLSSRLPLTKTFLAQAGVIAATPYPHVSKVTSHHTEAESLQEFHALLTKHAALGHCLFGGQLTTPLVNESRAGKTQKTTKPWVVFDFDKVEAADAADVVARYLPADCQNVSYVAQLSASMFRPDTTKWSGHIYMLLKEPAEEARLKQWIERVNFDVPALEGQISLSDSTQALHWPLDRSATYNSKLIYIAPPKCHGFTPAIEQAITYVRKKQTHLVIPAFTPIDTVTIRQKINALRGAVGLEPIDYAVSIFEGEEVLLKSGECDINGIKNSGDHYIRFNLNGGDSYAYFIDLRNPSVIRNFKGEPFLKTEEATPDLFKALRKTAPAIVSKPPLEEGSEVLAFYATNQNSGVKVGLFSALERRLTLNSATETSARAWMAEYGLVQKGFLPHMDLVFDPTTDIQYIPNTTRINTFRASDYMAREPKSKAKATLAEIPPVISKTLRSMLGNPNDELLAHFINWLSFVFQTRQKTGTAWILNGRTGTGKSIFAKAILTPIFGAENVKTMQFGQIGGQFNGFLEESLFVIFEEADTRAVDNSAELMAKLKHWITDSPVEIRKMRTDSFSAPNYTNFFFNANERTPVVITGDDRRFNIGERQEEQIQYTPNELKTLLDGDELDGFADVLARWPVDALAVTTPIETEAKREVHEATTSISQLIAEAISYGNLQFFIDRTPSDAESAADFNNRFNPIGLFKPLIEKYTAVAAANEPIIVPEDELFVLFRTMIPDPRFFQDSKTWRRRHYKSLGLDIDKQHRLVGSWDQKVRGVKVDWQAPAGIGLPASGEKVTPIKKRKKA